MRGYNSMIYISGAIVNLRKRRGLSKIMISEEASRITILIMADPATSRS